MNANLKFLCTVAAALALGFSACGDDDDDETATTGTGTQAEEAPAPTGPTDETVKITETEFKIEPAQVAVNQAGVVEFDVENAGGIVHALEVEGGDVEEETEDIAAGESATLKVELAEGTYKLYCPIGDHEDQGMVAELIVGGASSTGEGTTTGEDDSGGEDEAGDDNSGGAEAPSDDDDNSGGAEAPSSGY